MSTPADGRDAGTVPPPRDVFRRVPPSLETVSLPLLICDRSARPTDWNRAFADLVNIPPRTDGAEIDDATIAAIGSSLPVLDPLCAAALSGEPSPPSLLELGSTSERRALEIECAGWPHGVNSPEGVAISLRDVTGERSLAAQLHHAREEIVQFKYHVSHDLAAPIASARGLLGLIEDDLRNGVLEELPEMLEETSAQLTRLENLIRDLMSLVRVGAEEAPEPTEVDLRRLVDEIVASVSLHSRELEISVTLGFDSPTISTDRVRLRQILANLISNARKFRDPDEIAPYIHVNVRDEGDEWRISVSDNGIGMSRETADRAFDLFARGASTHPGHGLGLHIVLKHVDHLGGRVAVGGISKPTRIDVTLPKSARADAAPGGTD